MIKNNEKIKEIIMKPKAISKCKIGQDWYKHEFNIIFHPEATYPDYMTVNDWIKKKIDGQELNIEEAVDIIYNYLSDTYNPAFLQVEDNITDCKTHFDVTVIK